ncbi:MAG: UDP-N-acetylmuramate--L-alanine ligase [Phascolarctobacterium sp.]|nr:UDP-N-acetylmuramate--L-alanine ligase [Phascolarctobacterium sp.]
MAENKLANLHNIHFIGIGGAGMSALAYVLIKRGYDVSGSDLSAGHMSAHLAEEGAMVYMGHAACQVDDADAVVISTAIHPNNAELVAARERNLPVLHRSDVLAALLNAPEAKGVAVAGAHGKTTTSAMISCIAAESGIDPTIVIGGEVTSLGGNARNGAGPYVVAEADESDGSFLKFYPELAVVTNIEDDHLDHYGTEENIYQAFKQFLGNIREGGKAILCADNAKVRRLAAETDKSVLTYGLDGEDADYIAREITYGLNGTSYKLYFQGEFLTDVHLIVPGRHNVLNSMGAFAAAREMGIEVDKILASLKKFGGAKRRFETKGKVEGVWVVDDYAHHPTEIGVTLKAARQTQPARLLCVFQPHRYTRTQLLFDEFCASFADCDELILVDIYSAGEAPIPGVSSEKLAEGVKAKTGQIVQYIPRLDKAEEYLEAKAQSGDLIMTIGAGDVFKIGEELVRELERKAK